MDSNEYLSQLIAILERIKKKMVKFGDNRKELNKFLSDYKNDEDFNELYEYLKKVNIKELPKEKFSKNKIIESEEYIIDPYYRVDRYAVKRNFGIKTHDHYNMFVMSKVLKGKVKITSYMKVDYEENEE